jgi:hypothetical protein
LKQRQFGFILNCVESEGLMKPVKRTRSTAKKKSKPKTNQLKRVRGSLKGTRAMEVFVSERKRERKLTRSTAARHTAAFSEGGPLISD